MNKYSLFAMPATAANIEIASNERFSRITPKYILIYAKDKQPPSSMAIDGEDLNRLTKADKQWIKDCIVTLFADAVQKQPENIERSMEKHIEMLEQALKAEADKLKPSEEVNEVATDK